MLVPSRTRLRWILPALLWGSAAVHAQPIARIIGFDDMGRAPGEFVLPTNDPFDYDELRWKGVYVVDVSHPIVDQLKGSGYRAGCVSGSHMAVLASRLYPYSEVLAPARTVMAVRSLTVTALWRNQLSLLIEGYRGEKLVNAKRVTIGVVEAQHVELGFDGVDRLRFTSSGGADAGVCGEGQCSSGPEVGLDDLSIALYRIAGEPGKGALITTKKLWNPEEAAPEPAVSEPLAAESNGRESRGADPTGSEPAGFGGAAPEPIALESAAPKPADALSREPEGVGERAAAGPPVQAINCRDYGYWGVQAGAYRSEPNARRFADQLVGKFSPVRIYANPSRGVTVYRIVVGCGNDPAAANDLWELLRSAKVQAVAVFVEKMVFGDPLPPVPRP